MAEQTFAVLEGDERLSEIIAAYLEAVDAGWAPAPRELMARYPEVAGQLADFFMCQQQVARLADPSSFFSPFPNTPATPVDGEPSTVPVSPAAAAASRTAEFSSFGDYEVLAEIRKGGMGIVYKARQKSLNRLVAIKRLQPASWVTQADIVRFRNEAEDAANLDHPNIVPIYEVGEHMGWPYFSMKLFEGGSLAEQPGRWAQNLRAAAGLVATVARAVHHAHQRGLLHRDLKPANILLDADGQPHVGDFGLAKHIEPDSRVQDPEIPPRSSPVQADHLPLAASRSRSQPANAKPPAADMDAPTVTEAPVAGLTHAGAIVGTPSYMSPEQAAGQRTLTTAADVYGLGAILYKLVTGRPPFRADKVDETLRQVREQAPERPGQINPGIPPRLEAVCLKSLHKEPRQRYTTALALAEDLERWLRREPPLAWPLPWYLRAWRVLRAHVLVSSLTALCGFAVALALLFSYFADPDRPLKAAEARLAGGQAVTLIGPADGPAWFRWSHGQDSSLLFAKRGDPMSLTAMAFAQVKLLPNPQVSRYRLSAEIRHDEVFNLGEAGLYFGFATYPTTQGVAHYWCELAYCDLGLLATSHPGPDKKTGYGRVMISLIRDEQPGRGSKAVYSRAFKNYLPAKRGDAAPWRKLAVEVNPPNIQAFWEGEALPPLTVGELEKNVNWLARVDPDDAKATFTFAAHGGLGVLVSRGKASFRQVVIQPLE